MVPKAHCYPYCVLMLVSLCTINLDYAIMLIYQGKGEGFISKREARFFFAGKGGNYFFSYKGEGHRYSLGKSIRSNGCLDILSYIHDVAIPTKGLGSGLQELQL